MTDRLKGFSVVLVTDIREDDAESVAQAIRMIKGVLDVTPVVADSSDWMNRTRIRSKIRQKLFEALRDDEDA